MSDENTKTCPHCGSTMIKRKDYLPDDFDLTEVKEHWLCGACMSYELTDG